MRGQLWTLGVISLCALLAGGPGANAAVISAKAGDVLVSSGAGYAAVKGEVALEAGGRVLVQPEGLATITYDGGCAVHVGSGSWLVQKGAPCSPGETEIDFTGRMNQEAPPTTGPDVNPAIVAGVVAAGIVGLGIYAASQSNRDRPASP